MKQITEKVLEQTTNAWQRPVEQFRQELEIEASDVGRDLPNYLGFRHRTIKVHARDVGKKIIQYSGGLHRCAETYRGCPWSCWVFATNQTLA